MSTSTHPASKPHCIVAVDLWVDVGEIASRIVRYVSIANHVIQLPVSEAILTNKDKKYVLYFFSTGPRGMFGYLGYLWLSYIVNSMKYIQFSM